MLVVNGVNGGLKDQIRIWISGFEEARADQDGGMRRGLLTRQRVMRLECQLPKGKDRASCNSMKTTYRSFKRYDLFGWAGSQLRQAGSLIFMWHVNS